MRRRRSIAIVFKTDHLQGNDHGNEGKSINKKASSQTKVSETETRKHGTDNARELELRRIERDSICQVFASYQIKSHRLIRGPRNRHTTTRYKREAQDNPSVYDIGPNQGREAQRRQARDDLSVKKQATPIDKIGEDSAGKSEKETGRCGHESSEAEPERRVGEC